MKFGVYRINWNLSKVKSVSFVIPINERASCFLRDVFVLCTSLRVQEFVNFARIIFHRRSTVVVERESRFRGRSPWQFLLPFCVWDSIFRIRDLFCTLVNCKSHWLVSGTLVLIQNWSPFWRLLESINSALIVDPLVSWGLNFFQSLEFMRFFQTQISL